MPGTVAFSLALYLLMVVAFFWAKHRYFHIPVMVSALVCDIAMPFYLFMTRDWYRRLIEEQEIVSFLLWMHFGLVIALYALYGVQIATAIKMIRGDESVRKDHREQGKGLLVARALVIMTGALLAEPMDENNGE